MILAALPLLQMLLLETEKDSLLEQACQMYFECEFFIIKPHALVSLTHNVALPSFNCVEECEQTDLLTIFPKLYTNLCAADMNTLNEFSVAHKHLPIEEPDNKLGKEIIKCMWTDAAEGIKLQWGREYEFSKSDARATQLEKLAPYELSRLPTNNLDTEKDLSKFNVSRQ